MNILYKSRTFEETNARWCVYSHFDKNGRVEEYVFNALRCLNEAGFRIFLISTSPSIDSDSLSKLKKYTSLIAIRENLGYDFGSYKLGIQFLLSHDITPRQLLINNDSVFGPIFDLRPIVEKSKNYDVYGLTDSVDHSYHIQSYFIIYNHRALRSTHFLEFWNSVKLLDATTPNFKNLIIQKYEVGGTQFFIKHGFRVGAAFGIEQIIKRQMDSFLKQIDSSRKTHGFKVNNISIGHNPTHSHWEDLIRNGFPYIKRELLTKNPTNSPIENWAGAIESTHSYNTKMIIDALINHFGNKDFIYTNRHASEISKYLGEDGEVSLDLNPHFVKWMSTYSLSRTKKFIFDTEYYLSANPDVKLAIEKGEILSPVKHFIQFGHMECRSFKLRPVD